MLGENSGCVAAEALRRVRDGVCDFALLRCPADCPSSCLHPSLLRSRRRSERVHKTHATGQLLREATNINQSLHFLELVM